MKAQEQLLAFYEQWRLFTEEEGNAIRAEAWQDVQQFQTAKHRLKDRIVHASETLEAEMGNGTPSWHEMERQVRSVVEDLIVLETRNGEWLAEKRSEAEGKQKDLVKSGRNLRQLHQAYVQTSDAAWNSYS
jgi:hypothetical protein